MVSMDVFTDPAQKRPGMATTTAEAKANKASFLCLSSLRLTKLPEGLDKLNSLTNLDFSNNCITSIPEKSLPPGLVELTLTGCQLTELPASIGNLSRLKKLFAGANRLQQVDAVFRCPSLQHAGLSYNRLSSLPGPLLPDSHVMSLDLSHNDLEGLGTIIATLATLPSLAALTLAGNPLALAPSYPGEVRSRLKQLLYLDGQRLDVPSSRPSTATSQTSLRHTTSNVLARGSTPDGATLTVPSTTSGGLSPLRPGGPDSLSSHANTNTVRFSQAEGLMAAASTCVLTLTLRGLRPAEDPFGWLKARWAEQISTAEALSMTVPPELEVPEPPLQPVMYHVEMEDVEGTLLACIPIKLTPPTPPDVAVMFDPKAKAAAAAAAAKEAKRAASPKPAKRGGKPAPGLTSSDPATQRALETGLLRVTVPLPPDRAHRDWLRTGIKVTLHKTTLTATARPASAGDAALADAKAAKGSAAPRKKKGDETPTLEYDISSSTDLIGTAVLRCGNSLLDGQSATASERLDFVSPTPLFDEKAVRMALKDSRHSKSPLGHMEARMERIVRSTAPAGPTGEG